MEELKESNDAIINPRMEASKKFNIPLASSLKKKKEKSESSTTSQKTQSSVKFSFNQPSKKEPELKRDDILEKYTNPYFIRYAINDSSELIKKFIDYNNNDISKEELTKYLEINKDLVKRIFSDYQVRYVFINELIVNNIFELNQKILDVLTEIYFNYNKRITEIFWLINLGNTKINLDLTSPSLKKIRWSKEYPVCHLFNFSCPLIIQFLISKKNYTLITNALQNFSKTELKDLFFKSLPAYFNCAYLNVNFEFNWDFINKSLGENIEVDANDLIESFDNIVDIVVFDDVPVKLSKSTNEIFILVSNGDFSNYEKVANINYDFDRTKEKYIFKDSDDVEFLLEFDLDDVSLMADKDKELFIYYLYYGFFNVNDIFKSGLRSFKEEKIMYDQHIEKRGQRKIEKTERKTKVSNISKGKKEVNVNVSKVSKTETPSIVEKESISLEKKEEKKETVVKKPSISLKTLKYNKRLFIYIEKRQEVYTLVPYGRVKSLEPLVIKEYGVDDNSESEEEPEKKPKQSKKTISLKTLKYGGKLFIFIEEKSEVYRLNPFGQVISLDPIQIDEYSEDSEDSESEESNVETQSEIKKSVSKIVKEPSIKITQEKLQIEPKLKLTNFDLPTDYKLPLRGFSNKSNSCYVDSVLFPLFYKNNNFINKHILNKSLEDFAIKDKIALKAILDNQKILQELNDWLHNPKQEPDDRIIVNNFRKNFQKVIEVQDGFDIKHDPNLEVCMGDSNSLLLDIFDSFFIKTMSKNIKTLGITHSGEEIILSEITNLIPPIVQLNPKTTIEDYYRNEFREVGDFKKIDDFNEEDIKIYNYLETLENIQKIKAYLEFFKSKTRIVKKHKDEIKKELEKVEYAMSQITPKEIIPDVVKNRINQILVIFNEKIYDKEMKEFETILLSSKAYKKINDDKISLIEKYTTHLKEKIDIIEYNLLEWNTETEDNYLVLWVDRTTETKYKLTKSKESFAIEEVIISLKGEELNLDYVIVHLDTPKHYVCYFKNPQDNLWYVYNDLIRDFKIVGSDKKDVENKGSFESMVNETEKDCVLLFYSKL